MGRRVDYVTARAALDEVFGESERDFTTGTSVEVGKSIADATAILFSSGTQAFREALIGCALARLVDPEIDIKLPYIKLSEKAFSGRQLDQNVVNPFLRQHLIPCSTGPYLSTIRRNFRFLPESADRGIRDAKAFEAFLNFISALEHANTEVARQLLRYLLYWFLDLRSKATITLARVGRLSIEQYGELVRRLLSRPSGGFMPVLLAVAMFQTIRQCFSLNWEIEWQGINVADRASGVTGDITISEAGRVAMAVEVTEREIDRNRVTATFSAKVEPSSTEDYLFLFTEFEPTEGARETAARYFAQGCTVNFMPVRDWIHYMLGTIGSRCRMMFTSNLIDLLREERIPAALKVTWNEEVAETLNPPRS